MAKQGDIVIVQNYVGVVIKEHSTGEVDLHLFAPGNPVWKKVTLPAATTAATTAGTSPATTTKG